MRRSLGILLLLGLAMAFLPARAETTDLGVSPAVGMRATVPGRTVEETVQVVNFSRSDLTVTGSLTDLRALSDGTFDSALPGESLPSAAGWGTLEPATFSLRQGHSQTVKLTFKPPKGSPAQGYYAAAEFSGRSDTGTTTESVHAVLLEVGGTGLVRTPKIAVSASSLAVGSAISVTLKLSNSGNDYVIAQGRVFVRDWFGRTTATIDVPRTPVVPGTPRTLSLRVPSPVVPGRTRITAEITFGTVAQETAAATVYAFAWWHLAVAALVLLIIVRMILGFVRRRRLRRPLRPSAPKPAPTPKEPAIASKPKEPAIATAPKARETELQSSWDAPAPEQHEAPKAPVVVVEETSDVAAAEEEPDLWPEPRVIPRATRPADDEPVVLTRDASRSDAPPAAIDEPEPEPVPELEPEPAVALEPEPAIEPEPAVEPEPDPAVELEPEPEPILGLEPESAEPEIIPVPLLPVEPEEVTELSVAPESRPVAPAIRAPAAASEPVPAPNPEPLEEPEVAAARLSRLSEQLIAGIPRDPALGNGASQRRVDVALELLGSGSGNSAERIDVAVMILESVGRDARSEIEKAYEGGRTPRSKGGLATMALALAKVDSPRAAEALLRAYTVAPRNQMAPLKAALQACDRRAIKAQRKLLQDLPEPRRAALKLD